MSDLIEVVDTRGVATLTLNRPMRHNALDDALITHLTEAFRRLDTRVDVRMVVIAGNGATFCAGADIDAMERMAERTWTENKNGALALATMLQMLDGLSKPTLALVQGAVYGGGMGLVACCDIAIAMSNARFCLSEVKLGLAPAVVGPFVIRAIGVRQARRFVLTAEEVSAAEARDIGLVHLVATEGEFVKTRDDVINALLAGAPGAQAEAKSLLALYAHRAIDDGLMTIAAEHLAHRRTSAECREGLNAFLGRRRPSWRAAG